MPSFILTGPDGKEYDLTVPDGTSEEDIAAFVRRQASASGGVSGGVAATLPKAPPTEEFDPDAITAAGTRLPTKDRLLEMLRKTPAFRVAEAASQGPSAMLGAAPRAMLDTLGAGNPAMAAASPGAASSLLQAFTGTGDISKAPASFLLNSSQDETDQVLAIRKTVPGAQFRRDEESGALVVQLPDGTEQFINRPGPSPNDATEAGVAIAPFLLPVPFLGKPASTAVKLFAQGAVRGAFGGAVREGLEAPARASAGGETSIMQSAADAATDAVLGGIGEVALGPALRWAVSKGKGLVNKLRGIDTSWTNKNVREALKGMDVPDATLDQIVKLGAEGQDPKAWLRLVEAQQTGVPLIKGQVLKDQGVLAQMRALNAQGQAEPGGQIVGRTLDDQTGALALEGQRIKDVAGVDPNLVGANAGDEVLGPMQAARATKRKEWQELYGSLPKDAVLDPAAFSVRIGGEPSALFALSRAASAEEVNAPQVSATIRKFIKEEIQPGKPIRFESFDKLRRDLSEMTVNTDGPLQAGAARARKLFDVLEDRLGEAGAVASKSAPEADVTGMWKAARQSRREFGQQFEGQYRFESGAQAEDIVNRLTGGKIEPQQVMDKVFGAGNNVNVKSSNFGKNIAMLAERAPEQFKAFQHEAVERHVNQILGAKTEDALKKVMNTLSQNKKAIAPLVSEQQVQDIFRFARVKMSSLIGRTGAQAALPTGNTVSKAITATILAGSMAGGGAAGGMAGGVLAPGAVFGLALAAGEAAGKKYASRRATKTAKNMVMPLDKMKIPGMTAPPWANAQMFPGILQAMQDDREFQR